jgi:hypothetical protein
MISFPGGLVRLPLIAPLVFASRCQSQTIDRSDSDLFFLWGIFQHEYDHLEGILFLDRLASPADLYLNFPHTYIP